MTPIYLKNGAFATPKRTPTVPGMDRLAVFASTLLIDLSIAAATDKDRPVAAIQCSQARVRRVL
jgi:hypothetical protein